MAFKDVNIVMSVNKPKGLTGLGTPLLLVAASTGGTYAEFKDADAIAEAFSANHAAVKMARVIEAQGANKPSKIAVGTYKTGEGGITAAAALTAIYDRDFYFVVPDIATTAEKIAISDIVEVKGTKQVAHLVVDETEAAALKAKKYVNSFGIGIEEDTEDEYAHAALIGAVGSLPVGSVTWKFKQLVGVTPISDIELAADYEEANVNYYIDANGQAHVRQGITISGDFIDSIHGQHWIDIEGEKAIQEVFFAQEKVPYGPPGIALLESALRDVLESAGRQGIIRQNDNTYEYEIEAVAFEDTDLQDRVDRVYKGLSFEYYEQGAIHGADPVRGFVNF